MLTRMPDLEGTRRTIDQLVGRARDPYDTGFVGCEYKHDLLRLKWYIEDALDRCPEFGDIEQKWAQERTLQLLKKQK